MTGAPVLKLTAGTEEGRFHSHSYYDVPVFDCESRYVCAHQLRMSGRHPDPGDAVEIGVVALATQAWTRVGQSRAWSWQQGPLTQWLPNSQRLVWNDREAGRIVARLYDLETGAMETLSRPVYAIAPCGRFALSVNMLRLNAVRPGYGYAADAPLGPLEAKPAEDGVWLVPLDGGPPRLILSLDAAVRFLLSRLTLRQRWHHRRKKYLYWFNHVKISPDGLRFTVKLRFRSRDPSKGWNDQMGYSLTADMQGQDCRLLAHGASHVIWWDADRLYLWRRDGAYVVQDTAPDGQTVRPLAPTLITANAHIRHLPGAPNRFVFDTPYQRDIDLLSYDDETGQARQLARFHGHKPARGPFRCDLHPVPDPSGRYVCVTSPQDGGRQLYLVDIEAAAQA